ncbi:hypothetical protein OE88DRAFT_1642523 [Heliocybe sulcata]|uniref:Uncharacterized protein n=1 Tax=Heliocybe sulcata TaxID=5364 RepID=A0A5C3NEN2_9AGAM|nr:hypothetical protein OE88DRAFT_1642523 [Heliocybe sulcata]
MVPGSGGQHKGETCEQFLARRAEWWRAVYGKASAEQMRMYRAREESQCRFPCKGVMVYEWSIADEGHNIHQQCTVNRSNVSDMWGSIDPKYMVYDAVDSCWDCYQDRHVLQYTIDLYEDDGEDEDDFREGITFMPPSILSSTPQPTQYPSQKVRRHWKEGYSNKYKFFYFMMKIYVEPVNAGGDILT